MTIGIEAQRIFRKKKHGMDMVVLELIRNLQQIDTQNEYFVFVQPDEDDQVIKPTKNFKIISLGKSSYPIWEQILLPQAAKKYQCDILHCTSNTAPLFTSIPLVITLHDIIYMERSIFQIITGKGTPYQKFGNVYRRMVIPFLIKKVKKIITVSSFEKNRIASFFKLQNTNQILSIYNGVSTHFQPNTDAMLWTSLRSKYSIPEAYFFFMGNTDPKKNTERTIAAFSTFKKQTNNNIKLLMLDYDRKALEKLLADIQHPQLIDSIVLTGYINNEHLPAIYSNCSLFLYPSLRESFGIPIVEAMACGAAVITSNTSSMPEIAGNAALLIDPTDASSIANGMLYLHENSNEKNRLQQLGFQQAAKFTWRCMAEQALALYQQLP